MSNPAFHNFGFVDETGDTFEFHWDDDKAGQCKLEAIVQTERGPRRSQIASIPVSVWSAVSIRAVRELTEGMDATERSKKAPDLKKGTNRLGPLIGRELAMLLWALMEVGGDRNVEAILHGWRELAREERWWLYAKAAAPGQRIGAGWRLALFHALAEIPDSRATEPVTTEKKSPGNGLRFGRKPATKKKKGEKQCPASKQKPKSQTPTSMSRKRKQPLKPLTTSLKGSKAKNRAGKKAKKVVRKAAQNN